MSSQAAQSGTWKNQEGSEEEHSWFLEGSWRMRVWTVGSRGSNKSHPPEVGVESGEGH